MLCLEVIDGSAITLFSGHVSHPINKLKCSGGDKSLGMGLIELAVSFPDLQYCISLGMGLTVWAVSFPNPQYCTSLGMGLTVWVVSFPDHPVLYCMMVWEWDSGDVSCAYQWAGAGGGRCHRKSRGAVSRSPCSCCSHCWYTGPPQSQIWDHCCQRRGRSWLDNILRVYWKSTSRRKLFWIQNYTVCSDQV